GVSAGRTIVPASLKVKPREPIPPRPAAISAASRAGFDDEEPTSGTPVKRPLGISPLPPATRPGTPPAALQLEPAGTLTGTPAPVLLNEAGVTQLSVSELKAQSPRSPREMARLLR